ncbi:hypothetical protein NA78x_000636 [Anatilimnocola sp. NA78]|uniref:hypothetical protein n=1 Tax=Anatilimnocola sp. NA78 TaxID=3415683 RepID=UPI003CE58812
MWLLAEQIIATPVPTSPPDPGVIHHPVVLAWIVATMLVSTIVTWLVFRWRNARLKRRHNSPRQLLRGLCKLHHLSWFDRQLIAASARKHKISDPARFFLEASLWQDLLSAERSAPKRAQLEKLQSKLLDAPPTSPVSPA